MKRKSSNSINYFRIIILLQIVLLSVYSCKTIDDGSKSKAIIGTDEREDFDDQTLESIVGVLFEEGTAICSAFLSGPNEITTAAHCIYKKEKEIQLTKLQFVPGFGAKRNIVGVANKFENSDIVKLQINGNVPTYLKSAPINLSKEQYLIAWANDKQKLQKSQSKNRIEQSAALGVLLHQLDTIEGASGAPIIQGNDAVAVHIGAALFGEEKKPKKNIAIEMEKLDQAELKKLNARILLEKNNRGNVKRRLGSDGWVVSYGKEINHEKYLAMAAAIVIDVFGGGGAATGLVLQTEFYSQLESAGKALNDVGKELAKQVIDEAIKNPRKLISRGGIQAEANIATVKHWTTERYPCGGIYFRWCDKDIPRPNTYLPYVRVKLISNEHVVSGGGGVIVNQNVEGCFRLRSLNKNYLAQNNYHYLDGASDKKTVKLLKGTTHGTIWQLISTSKGYVLRSMNNYYKTTRYYLDAESNGKKVKLLNGTTYGIYWDKLGNNSRVQFRSKNPNHSNYLDAASNGKSVGIVNGISHGTYWTLEKVGCPF